MIPSREAWEAQRRRWARFGSWEASQPRPTESLSRSLAWMSDAWELAARHSSWWGSRASAEEHWRHLREIQLRFERSRLGP
jgi:hypothetical protein